jgi:hypothetical protein
VIDLLLDFSNSTLPNRDKLIKGAKAFVDEILVQRKLMDRVTIGVMLFDGSQQPQRYELPVPDAQQLFSRLDDLQSYTPPDGGATNLNGAARIELEQMQERLQAIMDRNQGGVVTTGHVVLFTDGGDTAGWETPDQATALIAAARKLQTTANGPSTVVQTWAVALKGEDYDPLALKGLLGDERFLLEAGSLDALEATFDQMGEQIGAQVEGTYLFAYCSTKRKGEHTVSLELKPTTIPQSKPLSFDFSAEGFEGGCDASFFEHRCDSLECGGFACGGCDDARGLCNKTSLRCDDFC